VTEPAGPARPDQERTTWIGRATPPTPAPPPTDPYWSPVEGEGSLQDYTHGYPAALVRPPKRRRTAGTVLVTVLGIFALCCAGGLALAFKLNGGLSGKSVVGAAPPGLNTPVRDGQFTFVVTSVSCGHPSVGRSIITRKAQGTFCLVALTVQNTGTESRHFSDGFQKLVGDDGTVYDADLTAGVIANENIKGLWNTIAKGDTVSGTIVYDVPTQSHISKVELHDSAFSTGAVVTL
jgi:hypothetical protein